MLVDFHVHAFAEKIAARAIGQVAGKADLIPETDGTAEGLRRRLQEWGVDKGVVLPIATKPTQQTIINDWAAQQQDETLYCYGSVHPDAPDVLEELERIRQLGLHGIKLHPDYQGFFADEPRMLPIYRRCAQLGLPVLFHAGFDPVSPQVRHASPEALARIAEAVPELTLIAAHLGGVLQWMKRSGCWWAGRMCIWTRRLPAILLTQVSLSGSCSDMGRSGSSLPAIAPGTAR